VSEKTVEEQLAEATAELTLKNAELERVQSAAETEASARNLAKGLLDDAEAKAAAKALEVRTRAEELTRPILDKLRVDLGGISVTSKIVFPEAPRHGNLSKADRQLLTILREGKAATDPMTVTQSADGGYWVPTELGKELIDRVRIQNKLGQHFRWVTMPTRVYDLPSLTADVTVQLMTEATNATASKPTAYKATLTAKKIGAYTKVSDELDEASVVPILDMLKTNMAVALADAEEKAICWGDTTTGATSIDKNTGATSPQAAFNGLWKTILNGTSTWFVTYSTLWSTSIRANRVLMGDYGVDPADLLIICDSYVYAKLVQDTNFITFDKIGSAASALTGILPNFDSGLYIYGFLDGTPVCVSKGMYKTNANGIRLTTAASNTTYNAMLVKKSRVYPGRYGGLKIRTDTDIVAGQILVVISEEIGLVLPDGGTTGAYSGIYNGS